jgi:hypothetical protein
MNANERELILKQESKREPRMDANERELILKEVTANFKCDKRHSLFDLFATISYQLAISDD